MKIRLSVTNLSSENNLLMFRLDGPVVIRIKVAEKFDKCPLNRDLLCIVCVQLGAQKVSLIQSSRMSTIQAVLMRNNADFQNCLVYVSWVSAVEGCSYS